MKNEEQQVQEKNKEGISTGNNRKDHHTAFDGKSSICKDPNSLAYTEEDLLLPEDKEITSREMIEAFGKRLKELRDQTEENGEKLNNRRLAEIAGCSSQTIGDIIAGKYKSINPKICNKLARYFGCSAYYLLGIVDGKRDISGLNSAFRIPIMKNSKEQMLNIVQAGQWAKIDRDLFEALEPLFHLEKKERVVDQQLLEMLCKKSGK